MSIAIQIVEPHSIGESLRALLAVEESTSSDNGIRDRLLALEKKLAAGRLHLAVLSQMKRGKSSALFRALWQKMVILSTSWFLVMHRPSRVVSILHGRSVFRNA